METNLAETEKRCRKNFFTKDEILALCEFVKQHRDKLFGRAGHCSQKVEARKKKYWDKAAEVVRAAGGRDCRSGTDLKKKWCDLKVLAKKYDTQKHKTGGGPFVEVNPDYEAVLAAMAPQARDGITTHGQCESDPFSNDCASQSSLESSDNSQPHPSLPLETTDTSATPGTSCTSGSATLSTGAEHVRGLAMQEEILKTEQAKLEVEKEKLRVLKETLGIHRQILAALKFQTHPRMLVNES